MTNLQNEYLEFMGAASSCRSESSAYRMILERLNPSFAKVVTMFLTITLISSGLTLAVCPQFGLGGYLFGHEIVHFAMAAGELACGALCALIFFGFSLLVSHFVLPTAYRRKLSRHKLVTAFAIPATVMCLTMISAAIVGDFVFMGLVFSIAWYAASVGLHFGFGYVWGRHASI